MSAPQTTARARDLMQIHALQRQLGMSSEDASALKLQLTDVASSGAMTAQQRALVIAHLRSLVGRLDGRPARVRPPFSAAHRKIWAMWQTLADQGKVADRTKRGLNAWVFRQTDVNELTWCNAAQIEMLVESLKQWVGRVL